MNGGGPGGDLGYNTEVIATVSKNVATKFGEVKGEILEAFGKFVEESNKEWYAKNAKDFFVGVSLYVDQLDKDLYDTGTSFLQSLQSAADAWYNMTGNAYDSMTVKVDEGLIPNYAAASSKVDNYQISNGGKVYMTADCEKNVSNKFSAFAEAVHDSILKIASALKQGELIGGNQSEAYVEMINTLATKFKGNMENERGSLESALNTSRSNYEAQAATVAAAKLEDGGGA